MRAHQRSEEHREMSETYLFVSDQQREAYLAQSLHLQDALVIGIIPPPEATGEAPQIIALGWVDTSGRPDIRDLGRVHATDGAGEVRCTWAYVDEWLPESYFVFHIDMLRPVQTSFRIAIHLPEYGALLEVISATGRLSIVSGPPLPWRRLIHTTPPAELLEQVYLSGGGDVTISMARATCAELRRHFEGWKRRQQGAGGGRHRTGGGHGG
jgi:hypothetical protein